MAEGQDRSRWNHTGAVLAMIANVNRDPKRGRPLTATDFNPYTAAERRRAHGIRMGRDNVSEWKAALLGGRDKRT